MVAFALVLLLALQPVPGAVTRPFDPPAHPYGPGHRGVDLAAQPGAAVRAALPGTVTFAGPVAGTGWVAISHGPALSTTYGDVVPAVRPGQHVAAGAVIGVLADGRTHLDWGARGREGYLDPMSLLLRWRGHLTAPAQVPMGEVRRVATSARGRVPCRRPDATSFVDTGAWAAVVRARAWHPQPSHSARPGPRSTRCGGGPPDDAWPPGPTSPRDAREVQPRTR